MTNRREYEERRIDWVGQSHHPQPQDYPTHLNHRIDHRTSHDPYDDLQQRQEQISPKELEELNQNILKRTKNQLKYE